MDALPLSIVYIASVVAALPQNAVTLTESEFEVRIPSHDQNEFKFFSAKNFAIIFILIAMIYLIVILVQICTKSDRDGELSEEFISQDGSLSYDYTYDEEYTNSQYLRSDDKNSLVDNNFKYDQSMKDSSSQDRSSNDSDASNSRDMSYRERRRKVGNSNSARKVHPPRRRNSGKNAHVDEKQDQKKDAVRDF